MKKVSFILTLVFIFSCEKEPSCKICKEQIHEYGKAPVITTKEFCQPVEEGYFFYPDSAGNMNVKMIICEK